MLVLTRKVNEAILIGDDIKITLLNIESDRIRIGIDAPKSMRIFRYETLKKVVMENQMAASANVNLADLSHLKEGAAKMKENAEQKPAADTDSGEAKE
jgi:carbon storage regulator